MGAESGNRSLSVSADKAGADDVLLDLIKDGDEAALARLYRSKSRMIYSLALNIVKDTSDAEEVTEEVFYRIWKNAGEFDRARGSAMAWMTTIARRMAIDRTRSKHYKGRMREVTFDKELAGDHMESVSTAAGIDPTAGAQARQVKEALDQLGDNHREVVVMSYFDGLSHSMIAERLNTPLGTVKTRIREAVIKLRRILDVQV
jgi:RNA polymerase sigma-70 factor (ECF subfamily)